MGNGGNLEYISIPKDQYLEYEQLNTFFMLSGDLLCIAGFDGYFKKINPAVSKLLGYTEQELMSRPINEFVFAEDRRLTSSSRDNIHRGEPLLHFENRYLSKTGEIIWLSWTSMPYPDKKVVLNQLIISDNGLGFDMEKLEGRIFGLYEVFHDRPDSKGIGLHLVYNHITSLGGHISVQKKRIFVLIHNLKKSLRVSPQN